MATRLNTPEAVSNALNMLERDRPGLITVRSRTCPPCNELHPKVMAVMDKRTDFDCFDLDVDDFESPELDHALTEIFQFHEIREIPAQLLLCLDGDVQVVRYFDMTELEEAMDSLYDWLIV